jgi:lactate dehydrogenase-like 2-hydroxyacid dehydrogenase
MKIAFFELEDWEKSVLSNGRFEGHTLHLSTEPLTERTLEPAQDADIVSVFVYSTLDRKILEAAQPEVHRHALYRLRSHPPGFLPRTGHCGFLRSLVR